MILIDTGPLVALCDRGDAQHRRAVRHLAELVRSSFVTCESVLTETCFHLPTSPQRRRLHALLEQLRVGAVVGSPDSRYRDRVFQWLARYAEHEPDWADGCLAVLSGDDPALRVWTYDAEFRTTWRRPDGSRIPLAIG